MKPTLWRWRAYFSPGLPSPTKSFMGMPRAEMRGRARQPSAPTDSGLLLLVAAGLGVAALGCRCGALGRWCGALGTRSRALGAGCRSAFGARCRCSAFRCCAFGCCHRSDDFLFLLCRARDRRDREVAALDRRLDALG